MRKTKLLVPAQASPTIFLTELSPILDLVWAVMHGVVVALLVGKHVRRSVYFAELGGGSRPKAPHAKAISCCFHVILMVLLRRKLRASRVGQNG